MNRRGLAAIFVACLGVQAALCWAQEPESRPVLAVLDFMVSGLSAGEAELFADMLTSYLVRTGAYRVIDRGEQDAVLRQIEFSVSDCSDESCQLQAGRMLAASRIVVGGIGVMGNLFLVSLRLLNVETGEAEVGLSEKYPSLEALAGDGERLAAALAGGSTGAAAASYRPLTAQSLISSAKAEELSARLTRLRRRVRPAEYEDWLKRKGFAGYERDAALEEKLVFLEEYLDQRNTRGHSLEVSACCLLPGLLSETAAGWTYTTTVTALFGVSLGWSYQLSNNLSAGLYLSNAYGKISYLEDDGMTQYRRDHSQALLCGGPTICFGNKVEGFAVLCSVGVGEVFGSYEFAMPLRLGFFYRNLFVGYTALIRVHAAWAQHQLDAGYSIFLGRRKGWPPRP